MKKMEQAKLIEDAIFSLEKRQRKLKSGISIPSVKTEYDIIEGKISSYQACIQLLNGLPMLVKLDME